LEWGRPLLSADGPLAQVPPTGRGPDEAGRAEAETCRRTARLRRQHRFIAGPGTRRRIDGPRHLGRTSDYADMCCALGLTSPVSPNTLPVSLTRKLPDQPLGHNCRETPIVSTWIRPILSARTNAASPLFINSDVAVPSLLERVWFYLGHSFGPLPFRFPCCRCCVLRFGR
jgi:hypothetical protein